MAQPALTAYALANFPLVQPGDDLPAMIAAALREDGLPPASGDVIVVAQKIVSKAEGRLVRLDTVTPSPRALELAAATGKDPRAVELVLRESTDIVRTGRNVIITRHRNGLVAANAGIDRSNIGTDDAVLLLPEDADASAARIAAHIKQEFGAHCGVIVADSIGRPWRLGTVGVAIGSHGITAMEDLRGRPDLFGRALEVSETGNADAMASAAVLLTGEGNEGRPVVLLRGLGAGTGTQTARDLLRPGDEDLFR